jgi:hypothetical protein
MKLEGKHVRFLTPSFVWFTRKLQFVGNRNTMQLLETALVLEGYLMRFFFPVLDRFFRQPLSEWTTVTVPYSRIVRFEYAPRRVAHWLLTAVLWLPFAFIAVAFLSHQEQQLDWAEMAYYLGLPALVLLLLNLLCNYWLLAPRNHLWFRRADGRRVLLVFRIPSRKRRVAFEEQLRAYRQTIRKGDQAQTVETVETRPSTAPWILLAVYLLAHDLVVPLYRQSAAINWYTVGFGDLLLLLVLTGARLLPSLLISLMLVRKRSAAVRWWAVGSLLVVGVLPVIEAILHDMGGPLRVIVSQPPTNVIEAIFPLFFHALLALVLFLATRPKAKEERP